VSSVSVTLRPYQQEAVDSVERDWASGFRSVLGTAATAAGKTIMFLSLLTRVLAGSDKRGLILAHRKELVEQPIDRLDTFYADWSMKAGIVMAEQDDCDKQITCATVQTLGSQVRLDRLLRNGPIDYLITDEAHHSCADTYLALFERLRAANPEMYHLGLTATPQRADERGLAEVYEKESFHFGIKELVSDGWLVPPRWLAIKTGISLAGVKTGSNGDFNGKQLADVFEVDNCFDLVVEAHQQYAAERQALAFVQSVAGAYRLAEKFREAGISAEAADGTTRKSLRADILSKFRAGKTQVLVNVGLYTEGLDVPRVSCIHQVRPTQSDGLYIQMIGRGLRIVPGKNDCVILDYAPVEYRNIVMLGDVLGSKVRKDAYIRDDDAEPGDAIGGMTFDGQVKFMHGSAEELISEKLDYLELTPWSWFSGDNGWLSLGLGEGPDGHSRQMVIAPSDTEGEFVMWKVYRPSGSRRWVVRRGEQADFGTLGEIGESLADKFGNTTLAVKSMRWRRQSASAKQLDFARRLGIEEKDLSKGECAQRITHALACRQVRQAMGR